MYYFQSFNLQVGFTRRYKIMEGVEVKSNSCQKWNCQNLRGICFFFTARCRWEQKILRRICKSTPSIDADKGGSEVIYRNQWTEKGKKTNRLQILGFLPEMAYYQTQWIQFFFSNFLRNVMNHAVVQIILNWVAYFLEYIWKIIIKRWCKGKIPVNL